MSENVKIKIDEYDKTSPGGRGIDSTDIAFVPGFSSLATAPKNQPTLVTSTAEFEQLFGKKPRILTSNDVKNYTSYGFVAGDYDRSYVYAKELLYQGMPVVYSNIVDDSNYEAFNPTETTLSCLMKSSSAYVDDDSLTASLDSEKNICITSSKDVENIERIIQFDKDIDITSGESSFEYIVTSNDCTIVSCEIVEESFKNISGLKFVKLSDTQYNLYSANEAPVENVKVTVQVTVKLTMSTTDVVKLTVLTCAGSALDVFYKVTDNGLFISNQWAVNGDNSIADKSIYSVKYITSGGYPSVVSYDSKSASQKFATEMLAAAAHRGDAVALIDYQLEPAERVFDVDPDSGSFYAKMHSCLGSAANAEYGAAMYPWSLYNCSSTLNFGGSATIAMPASFGYLMCVAKAIKSSPNWLAMAGVTRGLVPGISKLLVPGNVISNAIAEEMQPKFGIDNHRLSINTITNIRPYGLTLWGNRTLKPVGNDGTVALNFLNTRNMLSDIKKLLYTTAKSCMFEQNSTSLWLKFKSGIDPLLRRLKAGNGISDYKIVRGTTKYNGDPLVKGEIAAVIKIYPMYSVEYFELAVEINDEEVSVS